MLGHFLLLFALLQSIRGYAGQCSTVDVPLNISATNLNITLPLPQNNSQLIGAVQGSLTLGQADSLAAFVAGVMPVSGQYSISATLCMPNATKPETLLMLVHGLGFDKRYWSPSVDNETYSFASAAGQQGYATLAFDLLGAGNSSAPSGTDVVQAAAQADVIRQLYYGIKNGTLPFGNTSFEHVVGIGLGTGSLYLATMVNETANAFDGLVLGGFSHNTTGTYAFTAAVQPVIANTVASQFTSNFSALANDYQIFGSSYGTIVYYLLADAYPPELGDLTISNLQPFTVGEEFTLSPAAVVLTAYAGPILLMNGEQDLLFCGGACSGPTWNILENEKQYFGAANVTTYAVPDCGLVINYHYSAPQLAFPKTFGWLSSNGL